ncbi:MAG: ROK family protein [Anaerolineae bacterium]|nr:ROK family protein [Anaerolineae bacterium]
MHAIKQAVALDVGGSSVKSGLVTADGHLPFAPILTAVHSAGHADEILDTFASVIHRHIAQIGLDQLAGVALGFPGPFDYNTGVSRISGQAKYEALYGVDVKAGLLSRVDMGNCPLRFRNDAEAAIIGECRYGAGQRDHRIIGVTLGTGLGSAFVVDHIPQTEGSGIPPNGWLYSEIWRGMRADDLFSIRGLQARLDAVGERDCDLKTAAEQARTGDARLQEMFARFGIDLGDFLQPYVTAFQADAVLVLGGIAGALGVFGPAMRQVLTVPARSGTRGTDAALLGAADLIFSTST